MQTYHHEKSGADLAQPIAQPHAEKFSDVFTDYAPFIQDGRSPFTPPILEHDKSRMRIGPYLHFREHKRPSLFVAVAGWVLSRLRERTVIIDNDSIDFEIIDHRNGWSLVVAGHSLIIGSTYLAYIRTDSLPPCAGQRVRFNDTVAGAFIGQCGTVESEKRDPLNPSRTLYVVRLDTPTRPATHWSPVETLAVSSVNLEPIPQEVTQ